MKKFVPVSLALVGALGLSSIASGALAQDYYRSGYRGYATPCAAQAHRNGTNGAVLGALAGAVLGSNLASHHGGRSGGALIGALAGAAIGNNIARSSSADRCDGYSTGYDYRYAPANDYRRNHDRYRGYESRSSGYGYGYEQPAYSYSGWR